MASAFEHLGPALRAHLAAEGLHRPTPAQDAALPRIARGEDVLLVAPTGSGKTEAALLPLLDRLSATDGPGVRALLVTPLRALNRDHGLRLARWGERLGLRVAVRHGDTPPDDRRRQAREPPDLLVTTPETLQALLPSKAFRPHLRGVRAVVVDEVHQLARDRRGVQLAVALERLRLLAGDFQRVALSATAADPAALAALVGGPRPLAVVQVGAPRSFEARVAWPAPTEDDASAARDLRVAAPVAAYLRVLRGAVQGEGSALVFANSRLAAEIVASRLRLAGEDGVGIHHGSLDREVRQEAEAALREGRLRALVATPTLELGIDVGRVDRVALYGSPRRAGSLLQRAGRAAHRPDGVGQVDVVATGALDTLEALTALRRARAGALEAAPVHRGALDVLGHQVAGMVLDAAKPLPRSEALALLRRASPYADLPEATLDRVVAFLADLHLLARQGDALAATPGTRAYYYRNLSMINEQRTYPVVDLAEQRTLAVLGEEEVQRYARPGHTFVVRGSAWRIVGEGRGGELLCRAADDPGARVPDWEGEGVNVPFDVAQEAAALRAQLAGDLAAAPELLRALGATEEAARRVVETVAEQVAAGAPLPGPQDLLVEAFDHYLLVHAPFGEVVNDTLGDVLEELLARQGRNRFWWMDGYHLLLELTVPADEVDLPALVQGLFHHQEAAVEELLETFLNDHLPLGLRIKGPAERLGALPRGRFVGMSEWGPLERRFAGTVVEEEAMREVLLEHVDFPRVRALFADLREGRRKVVLWRGSPTPLGRFLLDRYVEEPGRFGGDDAARTAERLRAFARTERVALLCLGCGVLQPRAEVRHLPEQPACACGSRLLAPLGGHAPLVQALAARQRAGDALEERDAREVQRARQAAALVAVHGRRAAEALAVHGVGPQAAAKVLAAMHRDEAGFWAALAEARRAYLATKAFWDRDRAGVPPREPASKGYAYAPRATAFSDGRP